MASQGSLRKAVAVWPSSTAEPQEQQASMDAMIETDFVTPPRPKRGRETAQHLMNCLRSPPLARAWDFWHEKPSTSPPASSSGADPTTSGGIPPPLSNTSSKGQPYIPKLTQLAHIETVRTFWSVHNNFDLSTLKHRHAVHLFYAGIQPVWEDPVNAEGGSWSFRVPMPHAPDFWREVCMLAVGEQLREAVRSGYDNICGVSFSPRANGIAIIQVWNRDGYNIDTIEGLLEVILAAVPEEIRPKTGSYYYRKHAEHVGFDAKGGVQAEIKMSPDGGKILSPFLREKF